MKLENIDVNKTIQTARDLLEKEKNISAPLKSIMEILFLIISLLVNRFNLNSKNSSTPPSDDPNREKKSKKNPSGKKAGGQKGHTGSNLKLIENPDEIQWINIDKRTLPKGKYQDAGYSARQIIDIRISRHVIEYRAQILKNNQEVKFTAQFPVHVTRPAQYGYGLKAHSVYLSQFQLLTYNRIDDYFDRKINFPISPGSILNFNKEAYFLLENFDAFVKQKLIQSSVLNVDETSINI